MIKINLLPHREEKRKQRKRDFFSMLVFASIVGAVLLILVGFYNATQIATQEQRNSVLKQENARLDDQIKEIANLRSDIEGLKARQQAVEDLQGDRNQPVYLLDELVKQTPEGIYLRGLKQDGQRIVLIGYAESNERVSEFLRNLGSRSEWLNKPDLIEIRSAGIGQGRDAKKVFDFTINVGIKRPRDQEIAAAAASASAMGVTPVATGSAASGTSSGTKVNTP